MDQAQGNTNNDLDNQNNQPIGEPTDQQPASTPILVNVQTSDEPANEAQNDPVMDGVPSFSGVSEEQRAEMISHAESEVANANPQSTDAELQAVANEISSMVNDAPGESTTDNQMTGTNPMDQIMQEAAEEQAPTQDLSTTTPEPAFQQPSVTEQPTQMDSDSFSDQGPVASLETANEFGNEAPTATETSMAEQVQPANTSSLTQEPSNEATLPTEPPVEQPTPNTTFDQQLAMNDGELAVEPQVSEPTNSETDQNDAVALSEASTVVSPDAISAAVAAGTSGDNAITGSPESTSVEVAQATPQTSPASPKQKSSRGLIITVVTLITLLFGGGAVAAFMLQPKDSNSSNAQTQNQQTPATDDDSSTTDTTASPGETVAASTLDDYKAVCNGSGKITNATAYGGLAPHPVVVFEKGIDDKFAQSLVSFKDSSWATSSSKVESGQVVACISRKLASEVKLKDCSITDPTTKLAADVGLYSSTYSVNLYEALSGKLITSFENKSISTSCPSVASYNKAELKIFAAYDQVAFEASIKDSVTKVF